MPKRQTIEEIRKSLKGRIGEERREALSILEVGTPSLFEIVSKRKSLESQEENSKSVLEDAMESLSILSYRVEGGGINLHKRTNRTLDKDKVRASLLSRGMESEDIETILQEATKESPYQFIQTYPLP